MGNLDWLYGERPITTPDDKLKYKGLYAFCTNKDCSHNCSLKITDKLKAIAKRKGKEILTKDSCATAMYNRKELDTPVVNTVPAHDFPPFVRK